MVRKENGQIQKQTRKNYPWDTDAPALCLYTMKFKSYGQMQALGKIDNSNTITKIQYLFQLQIIFKTRKSLKGMNAPTTASLA